MTNYADIDAKVKPIIQKCLDGMKQASEAINPTLVSLMHLHFNF